MGERRIVVESFQLGQSCSSPVALHETAELRIRRFVNDEQYWETLNIVRQEGNGYVIKRVSEEHPRFCNLPLLKMTLFDRQELPQYPYPVGTTVWSPDFKRQYRICAVQEVGQRAKNHTARECSCCWLATVPNGPVRRVSIFGYRIVGGPVPPVASVVPATTPNQEDQTSPAVVDDPSEPDGPAASASASASATLPSDELLQPRVDADDSCGIDQHSATAIGEEEQGPSLAPVSDVVAPDTEMDVQPAPEGSTGCPAVEDANSNQAVEVAQCSGMSKDVSSGTAMQEDSSDQVHAVPSVAMVPHKPKKNKSKGTKEGASFSTEVDSKVSVLVGVSKLEKVEDTKDPLYTYNGVPLAAEEEKQLSHEFIQRQYTECLELLCRYRIAVLEDDGSKLWIHVPSAAHVCHTTSDIFVTQLVQRGWQKASTGARQDIAPGTSHFTKPPPPAPPAAPVTAPVTAPVAAPAPSSPEPCPEGAWDKCTICQHYEPLTGPEPPETHLVWFQCETCQGWVHAWCLGIYNGDADAPEHYRCPGCAAMAKPVASGRPLQLGDMVWARGDSSEAYYPAYLACPPPGHAVPDQNHHFVVYYGEKKGEFEMGGAYPPRNQVTRFTLNSPQFHQARGKDRDKLLLVLELLKLPVPPSLKSPMPSRAVKRSAEKSAASPSVKKQCSSSTSKPATNQASSSSSSSSASVSRHPAWVFTGAGQASTAVEQPKDPVVTSFLRGLGLEQLYGSLFHQNRITADLLPELSNAWLKEIGVIAAGDRMVLLKAVAQMPRSS